MVKISVNTSLEEPKPSPKVKCMQCCYVGRVPNMHRYEGDNYLCDYCYDYFSDAPVMYNCIVCGKEATKKDMEFLGNLPRLSICSRECGEEYVKM